MRTVKTLLAGLGLLVLAPLLALVGSVVATPFLSGFSPIDPDDPGAAAVAAVLTLPNGAEHCRSVPLAALPDHRDTLSIRLPRRADDEARCARAFADYSRAEGWPVRLEANERRYEAVGFEVEGTDAAPRFVVSLFSGDARFVVTRYRVDEAGEPVDVELRAAGPGSGVAAVALGGGAGLVVWGIVVLWVIARWRRRVAPGMQ